MRWHRARGLAAGVLARRFETFAERGRRVVMLKVDAQNPTVAIGVTSVPACARQASGPRGTLRTWSSHHGVGELALDRTVTGDGALLRPCTVYRVTRSVVDGEHALCGASGDATVAADISARPDPRPLYRSWRRGTRWHAAETTSVADGMERVMRINPLKVRLPGDSVLQQTASRVGTSLGSDTRYDAEFVGVTQLQAEYS